MWFCVTYYRTLAARGNRHFDLKMKEILTSSHSVVWLADDNLDVVERINSVAYAQLVQIRNCILDDDDGEEHDNGAIPAALEASLEVDDDSDDEKHEDEEEDRVTGEEDVVVEAGDGLEAVSGSLTALTLNSAHSSSGSATSGSRSGFAETVSSSTPSGLYGPNLVRDSNISGDCVAGHASEVTARHSESQPGAEGSAPPHSVSASLREGLTLSRRLSNWLHSARRESMRADGSAAMRRIDRVSLEVLLVLYPLHYRWAIDHCIEESEHVLVNYYFNYSLDILLLTSRMRDPASLSICKG